MSAAEKQRLDRATSEISLHDAKLEPTLHRLGDDEPAGLWITSLPWPATGDAEPPSLAGRPTYALPLGQWPDCNTPAPRRWLLAADGRDEAPTHIELESSNPTPKHAPPDVRMVRFAASDDHSFYWEQHLLGLSFGDRSVGLALGLRRSAGVHWWEACNLVITERNDHCVTIKMGGAIPVDNYGIENLEENTGLDNPYLHRHNWINGDLYVRAHANGVCEVFAHHVNARYVDDGAAFDDVVPVIDMRVWKGKLPAGDVEDAPAMSEAAATDAKALCGAWDGSRTRLSIADVTFDVAEVALLASDTQPGRMDVHDDLLIWQPYEGMELFGGGPTRQRTGDPWICRSHQHHVPRGMARTLRFSLSLGDRSPRVARYLAEPWWYGHCGELTPQTVLPVHSVYEDSLEAAHQWLLKGVVQRGFESGNMPRSHGGRKRTEDQPPPERHEPGWEGEVPYAQLLDAWRTGDSELYAWALRSAYYFTDVVVDHAANMARMHGYPPDAVALPMMRPQGPIAAYLETGDPYLFQTGEALVETAFRVHRNSWPRMATGRDAAFIRGAVLLWRYVANGHFRRIAHESVLDVLATQRPDGSFGDQGGGTGIHQRSGYVTKPWMAIYAINGVLDYLECIGDEPAMRDAARKLADWMMAERWDRGDGVRGLSYQHPTRLTTLEFRQHYRSGAWHELPTEGHWHHEGMARLMGWCAVAFDDRHYLEAWAESHEVRRGKAGMDQNVAGQLQFLRWIQSRLWRGQLDATRTVIEVEAIHFGPHTPATAQLLTPAGPVTLRWTGDGELTIDPADAPRTISTS